ncbi:MAG: DUF977 family protein [Candidatus Helarchaeota archaeon]
MDFKININSIALIGFDIQEGPVLKWKKFYNKVNEINIDQLYTNFYIMFKGGNKYKPKSIIFDNFQIIAFQNQMDLLLVFLDNKLNEEQLKRVKEFADKESSKYKNNSSKLETESDIIKEKLIEILKEQERVSIKQLRKHFPLSYWTIRRYLTDMEEDGLITRDKAQKEHYWSIK